MAYTALDKILAAHYNTFVSGNGTFGITNHNVANLNSVWGEGFNDKGYGQSTVLAQVSPGGTVTATQWATLIARMQSAATHQGAAITDMPGAGAGAAIVATDLIEAIATMQGNVDDIYNNRLNSIATVSTQTVNATTGVAGSWSATSVHTINVQFASAAQARYFFNAGGNIAITGTMTGGTAAKVDPWDDGAGNGILNESGVVTLEAQSTVKTGGSGVLSSDYFIESAIGYYGLGIAPIEVFKQFTLGGGAYPTNHLTIDVQTNGVQGATGDNGDLITFTVTLHDDVGAGDPVDGTTTVTATVNFPETTNLTNTWGAVTFLPAPTVVET